MTAAIPAEETQGGTAEAVSAVRRGLEELACEALLVLADNSGEPDLAHFVRSAHLGQSFLIVPRRDRARLGFETAMEREEAASTGFEALEPEPPAVADASDHEAMSATSRRGQRLHRALEASGVAPGRLALAGGGPAGDLAEIVSDLTTRGWTPVSGSALMRAVRKSKLDWQLEAARKAARATVEAMRRVARVLATSVERGSEVWWGGEPLTAGRLRLEIASQFAVHGVEQPRGNIVAAGRDAAIPHNSGSSTRILPARTSILIDLFPRAKVFADCTRTFCVGSPGEALLEAHGTVLEALRRAAGRAVEGVSGRELQLATCEYFEDAGHSTIRKDPRAVKGYVHNLGHGVGLELHELPSFRAADSPQGRLARGDLITLEPGLYDPDEGWGVRLEDMYLITATGSENLTPLPYALDPRAW